MSDDRHPKIIDMARGVQVTMCEGQNGQLMVGISLMDETGSLMAHAHFDVTVGKRILADLQRSLACAESGTVPEQGSAPSKPH